MSKQNKYPEAQEYLQQYKLMEAQIKYLNDDISELLSETDQTLSEADMKNAIILNEMTFKKEKIRTLKEELEAHRKAQEDIIKTIDSLPRYMRVFMKYKYIKGLRWPEIIEKTGVKRSTLLNHHQQALEMISVMLEKAKI